MNLKKKLTSVLSLMLALTMLLSTAALALETTGSTCATESTSPEDSSYSESGSESTDPPPAQETGPDGSASQNPTDSADASQDLPVEEPDNEVIPAPLNVPYGWSQTTYNGQTAYAYTYLDMNNTTVLAGGALTDGTHQVLQLPAQTVTINGQPKEFEAGLYAFANDVWDEAYTATGAQSYDVVNIDLSDNEYYQTKDAYPLMVTFENGIGTLFTGRCTSNGIKRRYEKGVPYTEWGLGTESTPNLYYYSGGKYQTNTSKKQLSANDGYHFFEGKLYHATSTTLNDKKTSPYAAPFTGRYTSDGVKRRYEKGAPYTGLGLGTESIPNLYYYVDGLYQTTQSKTEIKGFLGEGKIWKGNGKWYVATDSTLNDKKTSPYAPLTGYRTVKSKLYKYTKGAGALFTGIYNGYYYTKGMKTTKSGWVTVSGNTYYFKSGKAVTGWQYLKRNDKTYKYYFKSNGILVNDLFSYFGKSYLSRPMIIQINRKTHTADILLYDSAKKSYCIAAKSFVCSTCEKSSDFKTGTYKLYSNRRRRWFTFTHPETKKTSYYQYASFIVGTDAWIHSSSYSKKGNIRSLNVGNYNKLGTNQSFYCVRFQVANCKIVYDAVGKQGNAKVKVKLYNSSNKGPYGQIKLSDTTGKLSSKRTYDPTDPAL